MAELERLCCICGKPFDDKLKMGNNALPYREGRCCSKCNRKYVIPSRLFSSVLEGRMTALFNDVANEIESGEFELSINKLNVFGYKLRDEGQPTKLKEWKRNYYLDFCRNNKETRKLETKLISAAKSKLKNIRDACVDYFAKDSDYAAYLTIFQYNNKENE